MAWDDEEIDKAVEGTDADDGEGSVTPPRTNEERLTVALAALEARVKALEAKANRPR